MDKQQTASPLNPFEQFIKDNIKELVIDVGLKNGVIVKVKEEK